MEKDSRIAGCYKITNITNGKVYIGESNNILNRWRRHIKDLKNDVHINQELQKDFNITHSLDNFKFEMLKWFDCEGKTETEIKTTTLYLEAAYYILYKLQGYELYNVDRCNQVNQKRLEGYCTLNVYNYNNNNNNNMVEQALLEDSYNIFSNLSEEEAKIAKNMFTNAINIDGFLEIKEGNNKGYKKKYNYIISALDELYNENNITEEYNLVKILDVLTENNFLIKEEDEWKIPLKTYMKGYCSGINTIKKIITPSGKEEVWRILQEYGIEKLSIEYYLEEDYKNYTVTKKLTIQKSIIDITADVMKRTKMQYFEAERQVLSTMIINKIIKKMGKSYFAFYQDEFCVKEGCFNKEDKIFTKYCKEVIVTIITDKFKRDKKEEKDKNEDKIREEIREENKEEIKEKISEEEVKEEKDKEECREETKSKSKKTLKNTSINQRDKNVITGIVNELAEIGKYPEQNYDWHKTMEELIKANLITREEVGYVATDYALENNYYILRYYNKNGKPYYYISEKGRELVISILTSKDRDYYLKEDIEEVSNMGS